MIDNGDIVAVFEAVNLCEFHFPQKSALFQQYKRKLMSGTLTRYDCIKLKSEIDFALQQCTCLAQIEQCRLASELLYRYVKSQ